MLNRPVLISLISISKLLIVLLRHNSLTKEIILDSILLGSLTKIVIFPIECFTRVSQQKHYAYVELLLQVIVLRLPSKHWLHVWRSKVLSSWIWRTASGEWLIVIVSMKNMAFNATNLWIRFLSDKLGKGFLILFFMSNRVC